MKIKVKKLSYCTTEIRVKYDSKNKECNFFLSADWHLDNPKTDRKLLTKHLNQAQEKNAKVFVFGDLFCAMQGKYDKRSSKSDILPEHQNGNYLDSLVDTAFDFCEPYAENIALITPGNHETAIQKRHETDLTKRLMEKIENKNPSAFYSTYSGWVIFKFEHSSGGKVRTKKLFYHHGYGGGGPVTKGVIQTNRKAIYLPDADIVVTGHVHERWNLDLMRERIKSNGNPYIDYQRHIQLPTYKEEYLAHKGWHVERGAPPKPTGGCWLKMFIEDGELKISDYWAE